MPSESGSNNTHFVPKPHRNDFIVTLLILNVIAFVLLAAFFYFSFDLESGLIKAELSWGIPLILAAIFVLICGVLVWTKNNWKWGIYGLVPAILVSIYMFIILYSFSYVTLPSQVSLPQNSAYSEENKILGLILANERYGNSYVVVGPVAKIRDLNSDRFNLQTINDEFKTRGYDFQKQLEQLVEINQKPIKLNLASNDYALRFDKYYKRWGSADYSSGSYHPQVLGYSQVSLPAYDPESGYVLLYSSFFSNIHGLPSGGSDIKAYMYRDGKIVYIVTAMISMS
jgi:hypothetical protein